MVYGVYDLNAEHELLRRIKRTLTAAVYYGMCKNL